ncbi:MAG: hypothetical protein WC775_06115 [Patescibacteria group bacterium]|jgi:hypothetical protein
MAQVEIPKSYLGSTVLNDRGELRMFADGHGLADEGKYHQPDQLTIEFTALADLIASLDGRPPVGDLDTTAEEAQQISQLLDNVSPERYLVVSDPFVKDGIAVSAQAAFQKGLLFGLELAKKHPGQLFVWRRMLDDYKVYFRTFLEKYIMTSLPNNTTVRGRVGFNFANTGSMDSESVGWLRSKGFFSGFASAINDVTRLTPQVIKPRNRLLETLGPADSHDVYSDQQLKSFTQAEELLRRVTIVATMIVEQRSVGMSPFEFFLTTLQEPLLADRRFDAAEQSSLTIPSQLNAAEYRRRYTGSAARFNVINGLPLGFKFSEHGIGEAAIYSIPGEGLNCEMVEFLKNKARTLFVEEDLEAIVMPGANAVVSQSINSANVQRAAVYEALPLLQWTDLYDGKKLKSDEYASRVPFWKDMYTTRMHSLKLIEYEKIRRFMLSAGMIPAGQENLFNALIHDLGGFLRS